MKKAAFSVLVCLFVLFASQAKAQTHYPQSYSTHPHEHLSYSIDTVLNDPATGRVVLEVSMTVDLTGHPECVIDYTYMYVGYETWDDHWILVDEYGTSTTYTRTIEYNVNDDPYWLSYGWGVGYSDNTDESFGLDVYWW